MGGSCGREPDAELFDEALWVPLHREIDMSRIPDVKSWTS